MSLGFGIVGCGMIADFHARAIAETNGVQLVGCASQSIQSAESFANRHDCQCFATLDQLLADERIHAVAICSPSGAHLEPAIAAAAAGKHVVVEKPLEVTLERCDRIIETCRQAGVVLSTIFQSRFYESSQLLKKAIDQGRFGTLALADAYVKWFRTQEYYDSGAWRGTWQLDGGGALMNQAIHNIDLLCWFVGPVQSLTAKVATLAHERIEVEDTAVASLEFANGALGSIEATTAAYPGSLKRIEVYGSQGSAVIEDESIVNWQFAESDDNDQRIIESLANKNVTGGGASDPAAIGHAAHARQYADIAGAIQSGQAPLVDGPEARRSVEVVLAIYKASRSGATVTLPL